MNEQPKSWCINPHRQAKDGDATVTLEDIKSAAWVDTDPFETPSEWGWLEVHTKDGREIQSELYQYQADAHQTAKELKDLGISILDPCVLFRDQSMVIKA